MKSRLAAMVVATVLLMMFAEVSTVRAALWINPLFESYSAANKSHSIVKLSDGSLMVVQDNATRTSTDKGITWSEPRLMGDGKKPGIP